MSHLLVQEILILGGVHCCASGQLTFKSQCCHLFGHSVGGVIIIFIFSQCAKCVLHVGVGGSISLLARSGCCSIQSLLERLLDHAAQLDICLVDVSKEIPRFKSLGIQSGIEEKMNHDEYQLLVSVWVLTQKGNLGAILNSTKQDLQCIGCQIRSSKNVVIGFKGGGCRLAIDVTQLVKDVQYAHACMPTPSGGDVRHLKRVIDACVVGSETCI
jgi:hypothetical protein